MKKFCGRCGVKISMLTVTFIIVPIVTFGYNEIKDKDGKIGQYCDHCTEIIRMENTGYTKNKEW